MLSVPLHYRNHLDPPLQVEFRRDDLPARQRRHRGRYALIPRLKLSEYRCSAVIDFVELLIETQRPTNFPYLRKLVASALHLPSLWCKQVGGSRNSSTTFSIVIHDPRIATVMCIDRIVAGCPAGLAKPVKLTKIEVSVDLYPRSGFEADRLAMVGVLQRTYMPPMTIWTENRMQPRFVWGQAKTEKTFFLPSSRQTGLHHQLTPKSPYLDSTVYFGEKGGPWQIRIQNKISNRRDTRTGRVTLLAQKEKRARIEVTLTGSMLEKLKVATLQDLTRFSFTSLQGDFFHFALPTFQDRSSLPQHQAIQETENDRDRQAFSQGGVACLERLRDTKETWFHEIPKGKAGSKFSHLQMLPDLLRVRGVKRRDRRVAKGVYGSTKAYDEMNSIVRSALRDLERKILGGEKRS